jgi:hypothetical protein
LKGGTNDHYPGALHNASLDGDRRSRVAFDGGGRNGCPDDGQRASPVLYERASESEKVESKDSADAGKIIADRLGLVAVGTEGPPMITIAVPRAGFPGAGCASALRKPGRPALPSETIRIAGRSFEAGDFPARSKAPAEQAAHFKLGRGGRHTCRPPHIETPQPSRVSVSSHAVPSR